MTRRVNGRGHRQLTMKVPVADHQRFKVAAARQGATMSAFLDSRMDRCLSSDVAAVPMSGPFTMMTIYVSPERHAAIKRRAAELKMSFGELFVAAGRGVRS